MMMMMSGMHECVLSQAFLDAAECALLSTSVHVPEMLSPDTEVPDVGSMLQQYAGVQPLINTTCRHVPHMVMQVIQKALYHRPFLNGSTCVDVCHGGWGVSASCFYPWPACPVFCASVRLAVHGGEGNSPSNHYGC
jgi:hypothetical protein